jgi:hypothetical protein
LEPDWKACANCKLVVWDDQIASSSLDPDVRRDQKGTSIVLILLAVLGGLGIFLNLWAVLFAAAHDPADAWVVASVLGVVFALTLVVTGIMSYRARHAPVERGVGGIAFGTMSVLGGLFVVPCAIGTPLLLFFAAVGQEGRLLAIISSILIGTSVILILAIPLGRFRPHTLIVLLFTLPAVIAVLILFGTTCAELQKL